MTWVALKMLTGDRSKYFAIIFGVSFACFLIAEQSAIFCGIMLRTTSQIRDTQGVDVWVMNAGVRYVDDAKAISDDDVFRVRSVPGVAWSVVYTRFSQATLIVPPSRRMTPFVLAKCQPGVRPTEVAARIAPQTAVADRGRDVEGRGTGRPPARVPVATVRRAAAAGGNCPRAGTRAALARLRRARFAIDARTGQTIIGLIRQVAVQPGRVAVVVTHDPRVFDFGDRIVTLEDGRIAGDERVAHGLKS